ncbi:Serine--tRNA ligase [Quillaja saponaria]|uniref:Serine--tRNA ligase n=1 Tax=Quillaja saponaria TaxID=32244 RepID=A0AAD7L1H0_QUISA|nr:Serine--tRNA ligase [Quillaja saponaria]
MAKFNVVQKRMRAQIAERKRAIHGDPYTGKLKIKPQPVSISGKRKRKLLKKWRRDQKEAIEKGLVSMEDVEMAVAEDSSRTSRKIHLKKNLKLKQLKRKGKNKRKTSKPVAEVSADIMVE